MKKLTLVLAVAAAASGLSAQALAVGRLADVTVTDRSSGATLPVHYYRGEYWVAGVPGAKYAIDIRNASGRRVLAVTSVDGVNVVSGETASTAQTGYVLGAYQRYDITGWRKGNDAVAAFEFTASPNSYAERTGRPRDVGVIGVALFRERAPVQVHPIVPYHSRFKRYEESEAMGAPAAPVPYAADTAKDSAAKPEAPAGGMRESRNSSESSSMAKQIAPIATQPAPKLGTGHGERESSYVTNTEFERESSAPAEVIRIRYDSHANLLAMGVIPTPRSVPPRPNPFPDGAIGYVPDPPRWK
jgi:hypothetical protein